MAGAFAMAGGVDDALSVVDRFREQDPTTAEECLDRLSSGPLADLMVDTWYCDTEFANIWQPGMKHVMLRDNRELVRDNYARIVHGAVDPASQFSAEGLSDPDLAGGKVSRLFARWPNYQDRSSVVLGRVAAVQMLYDDDVSSDWVVQLGTVRDPNQVVYLRVVGPPGWQHPGESKCPLVRAEGIPIARGYVPRGDGDGLVDVIYEMATKVECFPLLSEEDIAAFEEGLPPDLRDAFDEGASGDRW
ncbi:hypothetical protein [Cellulomonas cellasea]|nr:hypothetical protein [Cellulomonas cellasea]